MGRDNTRFWLYLRMLSVPIINYNLAKNSKHFLRAVSYQIHICMSHWANLNSCFLQPVNYRFTVQCNSKAINLTLYASRALREKSLM